MKDRAAWLEERRTGVGGSDASAVLGLSKWRTKLDVYLDKRGEGAEIEDNEAMLWGRVLEAPIRQQYAERTGRVVRVPLEMIRHPQHTFMLANLDGVTDDNRLLEIKTARSAHDWGEIGSDQVPQGYLLQVQHYLAVTAIPICDVAVLIGGSDFRIYEVPADIELQEMLIEGEAEFWSHVTRGIPPDPVTYDDMQSRYGRASRTGTVEASTEVLAAVQRLRAIQKDRKDSKTREEDEKATIMGALGDTADTLIADGLTLATWKAPSPAMRVDAAALQAAHPDIYKQFTKADEASRRFLLK